MSDEQQGPPTALPIDRLDAHPSNSNVMPKALFGKLVERIGETGRYPAGDRSAGGRSVPDPRRPSPRRGAAQARL